MYVIKNSYKDFSKHVFYGSFITYLVIFIIFVCFCEIIVIVMTNNY